jgi:EAL domain-containing protein (putative c-di-GMP-specific phosphodiesterase class I)
MAADSIFSFIDRQDDGLWTARHGNFTLKTSLQPIFRQKLDGTLHAIGSEGLLRPFIDHFAMAPAQFFATADLPLVENVDSLSRMVHVLNHGSTLEGKAQNIFVSFHPAVLQSAEHISRELQHLHICVEEIGLLPANIVCQISTQNLPDAARLNIFCQAVRSSGFKLAISHVDGRANALPSVFTQRPDFIKLTIEWVKIAMSSPAASRLLKRVVERCALLEIEPVMTGIESKAQLAHCRLLHPVHLQGHRLAKPALAQANYRPPITIIAPTEPMRRALRLRSDPKKLFSNAFSPRSGAGKRNVNSFGKRQSDPDQSCLKS